MQTLPSKLSVCLYSAKWYTFYVSFSDLSVLLFPPPFDSGSTCPCPLGGPAHETLAGITHDICMLLETRVNVRCVLTDFSKTIDPLFTVSARFLIFIACMDHCFSPSECSIILTLVLDVCINQ